MEESDEEEEEEPIFGGEASHYSFPGKPGSSFFDDYTKTKYEDGDNEVDGLITEQHLKDISYELGLIKLCWTDVPNIQSQERVHYPITYLTNSKKEKLLLWYAENFRQQIRFNYPYKRPLLLACDNECGVQKMVSTTIQPTNMRFPEFKTWQGCATFVAEYLFYEELDNPVLLPDHINSPQTVLKRQAGHSFEYSTVLTSFLIGSGYDAYVVSGYATREVCKKDQTRVECPFLKDEPIVEEEEKVVEDQKYFLRKPVELKSKFLAEMEAREHQKEIDAKKAQELAELEAIKEFEKPPPDELGTWRLHSWVVVLPSKEVTQPFFIETTTGIGKEISDPDYHGIESVWNHHNYWVLMQFKHKTVTCKDIKFDLNNPEHWERLLIAEPITFRELQKDSDSLEGEHGDRKKATVEAEKHLDMPCSWAGFLTLSHSDYEKRYPKAKKVVYYRKAISEQLSPYCQSDGLVLRVARFDNYEYSREREMREQYMYRSDRMYFCQKRISDNLHIEKFERGREDALKERHYYAGDVGVEAKFTMLFYHEARSDGLCKLEMSPDYLTMHFENRADLLYYVHVNFAKRTNLDQPLRVINKITEKYHRNPKIEADKDLAVVEFCYLEKQLRMKFHYEPEHLTQTHRMFLKPVYAEREARLTFDPSLTSGYLTDPQKPPPKPLYLYRLELEYFKQEEIAEQKIRERENELLCLLRLRMHELAAPRLIVSEFDTERNAEAKKAYHEQEEERREMEERELTFACDFLAPYYAKIGMKPKTALSSKLATLMVEECLEDWKKVLVDRANVIQQQFEQTCQEFQEKSNWYEKNQSTITKEKEEEYFEYCKQNSYYLHILEVRLNRHKETAPKRFLAIQDYLKNDPRLYLAFKTRRGHFK